MGVPTSEVGYTIATTRGQTTKVHKNVWWHWREREKKLCFPTYATFQASLVRVTARAYVLLWVFWVYVYVLRV